MSNAYLLTGIASNIPASDQIVSAAGMQATETNVPELVKVTGSNLNFFGRLFNVDDQATWHRFVPSGVEVGSTLTLRLAFTAVTAAASKNVQFRFSYAIVDDDETWDVTYTNIDSGDIVVNSTQDDLQIVTWTASLPAAFTAGSVGFYMFSRIDASADELVGAVRVLDFQPEIARN